MTNDLLKIIDKTLYFDDINLDTEIAQIYGTPTYVFSANKIRANIYLLQKSFSKHYNNSHIAYSMKNNFIPEICSIIAEKINTFETTSLLELRIIEQLILAKKSNLNVISTNLYKPDGLIEELINYPNVNSSKYQQSSSLIAIDSYQDFKNVERVAKALNKKIDVIVRVNPGIVMDTKSTIFASSTQTAKCASLITDINPILEISKNDDLSKWVLSRDNPPKKDSAENIILEASKSDYLNIIGLHGHLGSQVTNIHYYESFFEVITLFSKLISEKYDLSFEILDLGGGYPVQYSTTEEIPTINDIALLLASKLKEANIKPKLIIESGRFITATAGLLLSRVNLIKEVVDGSKNTIMDFSVYSDLLDVLTARWYYETLLVNNIPEISNTKTDTTWHIIGGTNDTLDQLDNKSQQNNQHRPFPRNLEVGDLIAIKNAGAYTTCFNSNYCGRPKPLTAIIDHSNADKIITIRS